MKSFTSRLLNRARTLLQGMLLPATMLAAPAAQAQSPAPEVGVAIQPTFFNFSSERGQSAVQTVTVMNNQPAPIQLRFYVGDWLRDSTGQHNYFPAGTLPRSCSKWITLSREFVEVGANSTITFDMRLTVPDSPQAVETMRWAMLFAEPVQETEAPKPNANQVASTIIRKQRIGLHIYQTPPTVTGKEIKMVSFQTVANEKNMYRITCDNTGNLQVQCKPYLELTALDAGGKTTRIDAKEFPMFPGQRRIIDIPLPDNQPKGKYNIVAAVDAGEDLPLEAAQAEITVQ